MEHEYLHGRAFVKKSKGKIQIFETPYGLGDFVPVLAEGTTKPRMLKDRFADVVNVKDFGAVGDGVTDDTAAIQAANNFAQSLGKGLRFTSGVYPAHGLQMTASWDMEGTAKLLFNGSADESCVTCAVDNLSCGSVNIDANAIEVDKLFCVSGNKNHFDSITLLNGKSETILVRMLIVEGNDNFFGSVVGIDHVKGSYWNDSSPQCVCLNGTGTGNSFDNIFARNCRSTVVNNATGKNFFGNVYSVDAKDNGFYAVAGSSYIDSIFYDGDDNGVEFRHGANAVINSVNLARIGAYGVFFGDCGDVTINSVAAECGGGNATIFGLNETGTGAGKIVVNSFTGSVGLGGTLFFLPKTLSERQETVKKFSLKNANCTISWNDAEGFSRASFLDLSACDAVELEDIQLKIVIGDDVVQKQFFYMNLQDSVKASKIENVRIEFVRNDGSVDQLGHTLFVKNVTQQSVSFTGGEVTTSGLGVIPSDVSEHNALFGSVPTSGSWRKGQLLMNTSRDGRIAAYLCTESGTPGVWKAIPTFDTDRTFDSVTATRVYPTAYFYPTVDNAVSVGTSAARFSLVFAATGAINTSDEREKTSIVDPDEALMRAWGKVNFRVFQFKDAVEKKGADARLHVGVIAQQVINAFASEGLDATRYGLLCYDKWDDEYEDVKVIDVPEIVAEDGTVTPAQTHIEHRLVTPAGDRYGIRYEEALALEAAYQRWRMDKLEAALIEKGVKL